jgi:serine phosphatase RsbU (regulator of sigma subunit)
VKDFITNYGFDWTHVDFYMALVIIIGAYGVVQYRTRVLRKSNAALRRRDIIARHEQKQSDLLSLRNKNIEDSLKYAQRIQQALFTNQKTFSAILPESFILHESKDIVSGDFFWVSETNSKIFLSAVDCTGHGVPGAFMSIIGFELFRKIIIAQKIYNPADILNHLNQNFEEIFGSQTGETILNDGMDLSFCTIDKKTKVLEYAGAFNSIYIIRENKLIELKADRFSIGADGHSESPVIKSFSSHTYQLDENDVVYLFSDGYPDQFGGPEGKKFKYRRFRHLLLAIHELPLERQKQYLKESIEEWKGNYEQVDDVLVIGLKPVFSS